MTDPFSRKKPLPGDNNLTPPASGAGGEFGTETDDPLFGQTQQSFEDDYDGWDPHEALVRPAHVGALRVLLGRILPFILLVGISYGIYRLHLPLYATIPLGIVGSVIFALLILTIFGLMAPIKYPECGQVAVLWWKRKINCPECGYLDIRDYI